MGTSMNDQDTTDNFWQVWNNFVWPEPIPVQYRCYYLDDGTVDFYTMEHLPGNYIEVTKEQYLAAAKPARVQDGKLIVIKPRLTVHKLVPGSDLGTKCHAQDVCVIVFDNGILWNQQQHEID
jgi:hypothetical protein